MRSAEPPSFVQIMGEAIRWVSSPLKVAATVFLSQLAKEAASDVYKNKKKIADCLTDAATVPLRRAAAALKRAHDLSPRQPGLVLGLSVPDEYFGTALSLGDHSEEEIAYILASFVSAAETIQQLIQAEIDAGHTPLGRVQVIPTDQGGFELVWIDQKTFKQHTRTL